MRKYIVCTLPVLLLVAPVAFGGTPSSMQMTPASTSATTAPVQYDDATLLRFAKATLAARKVHKEYATKINAASDKTAKDQLKAQERRDAAAAVTQYMPVSEYKTILHHVRNDPQLKARVKKLVKEHRSQKTSSGGAG